MGDAGEVLEVLLNDESAGGSPERAVSGKALKLKERKYKGRYRLFSALDLVKSVHYDVQKINIYVLCNVHHFTFKEFHQLNEFNQPLPPAQITQLIQNTSSNNSNSPYHPLKLLE